MAKKPSMYSGLEKRLGEREERETVPAAAEKSPPAAPIARAARPVRARVKPRVSSHRDPEAYSTRTTTGKVKVNLSISVELDEALVYVFKARKAEAREAGEDLRELTKAGIVEEILRRDGEVATALRDLRNPAD